MIDIQTVICVLIFLWYNTGDLKLFFDRYTNFNDDFDGNPYYISKGDGQFVWQLACQAYNQCCIYVTCD